MRPEDLTVALRPRQPWEAADLGCALTRRDIGSVLALWCVTVLPLWGLLAVLMQSHAAYYTMVVWWLKPLYDRVPLHVLSRSAFGARTRLWQGLRALPRLWGKFLLPALLWRRLSPARSFVMPIWMLEGQRGAKLRQRAKVLASEGGSSGATLTWVFIKLEIAVFLGLLVLTSSFAPDSGYADLEEMVAAIEDGGFTFPAAWYWWYNTCYIAAVTIVEPFYTGAGFGLYLNCRSKLEGWDVELAFRQTAARLQKVAAPMAALLLLLTACPLTAQEPASEDKPPPARRRVVIPAPVEKEAESPTAAVPANGNDLARKILDEPEFEVQKRTRREWVTNKTESTGSWFELLMTILQLAGYLLLALFLIALIIWLLRAALRLRAPPLLKGARRPAPAAPALVMGLSITPESLPADLLAAARAAWTRGDPREALSLLYRGALSILVDRRHLPIRASDTEDDCQECVRQTEAGALAGYFDRLTRLWTRAAYAGQAPAGGEFDALCQDWPFTALERLPARQETHALPLPVLLTALLCCALTACNGRWEEVEHELGHRGKARIDPFLAAQRFLEERGHSAGRAPNLLDLPPAHNGLVLTSAEGGMPAGRARPLLDWVRSGGHLVYALVGTAPYNDWTAPDFLISHPIPGGDERQDPILEALGVRLRRSASEEKKIERQKKENPKKETGDEDDPEHRLHRFRIRENIEATLKHGRQFLTIELPESPVFDLDRGLRRGEFRAVHEEDALMLSLRHGSGRVTLLNHARPLRNRYLSEHDHGRVLDLLLDGKTSAEALFVVGLEGSFWELLWQRAWRVLLGLGVLLAVWLWAVLPRFGPVRAAALHPVRRFADHLETLGHFYYQARRQTHLIAAAQSALRRRLRETHPHLTAPADQERFLAERAGLPLERIVTALSDPASLPASQLIRLLQDLQTLRHSLS